MIYKKWLYYYYFKIYLYLLTPTLQPHMEGRYKKYFLSSKDTKYFGRIPFYSSWTYVQLRLESKCNFSTIVLARKMALVSWKTLHTTSTCARFTELTCTMRGYKTHLVPIMFCIRTYFTSPYYWIRNSNYYDTAIVTSKIYLIYSREKWFLHLDFS